MKVSCLKHTLCIIFVQAVCLSSFAQDRNSIFVCQFVRDSFTKYGIPDVFITLADSSGVLIDTMRTERGNAPHDGRMWHVIMERKPQTFTVKAEHPDYETVVQRLEMKRPGRLTTYRFPELFMKRKMKEATMDELTVTATRVQLAYKGDTLVVDARAFKIPEGSMLDALVANVPGAELHEDGTIYMNGRKVDYLTLNGKDFFKGNNRIMLDNLPYYVVDKLKFYEKDVPLSQMVHQKTGQKDYVMDVELKQEYSIGYMANAEAGAGTDEKWLARLFGLRFTDNSRIVLFAGANNTNEVRPPGGGGWYAKSKILTGEKEVKLAGGNFSVNDKHGRFMENVDAMAHWTDNRDETRTARETFLANGAEHGRTQDISQSSDFGGSLTNKLHLGKLGLTFDTNGNYSRKKGDGLSRAASFTSNPSAYGSCTQVLDSLFSTSVSPALQSININKVLDQTLHNSTGYGLGQSLSWDKEFAWGDNLSVSAGGNYNHSEKDNFSRYALTYPDAAQPDNRQERFMPYRNHGYSYNAGGYYRMNLLGNIKLTYSYKYTQDYSNTESSLYRLDWLGTDTEFGMLPSQADYLKTLDTGNSYRSLYMTKTHSNGFGLQHNHDGEKAYTMVVAHAAILHKGENVRYWRSGQRYGNGQGNWFLEPFFLLTNSFKGNKPMGLLNRSELKYESSVQTPSLVQRLNIEDTSNPLAVTKGNPNLKTARVHRLEMTTETGGISPHCHIKLFMNFLDNMVANGFTYDPTTGVYTYRPENVKGNWNTKAYIFYRTHADKKKRIQLQGKTGFDYAHNVDLAQVEGFNTSRLSKVDHYITSQNAKVSYNKESLRLELGGDFAWNVAERRGTEANGINAFDFSYGLSGQYTLPWKIQIATDLKMYSRRGYEESSMNTNELVWNASLSRAFLKEKLVVQLNAYDLLNQLSTTRYVVNGQGRTETWQLTVPRYAMLKVAYKFNKNPKKK